ncbi:MAG TPA: lactate racemase domain-containing protein [Myxococcales bacterium]|nr:lactate racemase domain-containing protein [Myxococcales bacterium]
MPSTLMMSGFDLRVVDLPEEVRILMALRAQLPLDDARMAIVKAMMAPVAGPPLTDLVASDARVTVLIDDLSLPVPPPSHDPRADMLDHVLAQLQQKGIRPAQIKILVANGLSRQWRPVELADALGERTLAAHPVICHDAEDSHQLARIGEIDGAPIDVNKALVEADLVVHLNVVSTPLMAGAYPVVKGVLGYKTVRGLVTPELFDEDAPFLPGSALARAHQRVAELLFARVKVVQLSTVLSNDLWPPPVAAVLQGSTATSLTRPLQMWNALPGAVRHRAARLLRASYRPLWFGFGPPGEVEPRARAAFRRQHEVAVEGEADVLLFGLPDVGPGSVRSAQNPVLAAELALGYVYHLFTQRPLLRQGGAIIIANPFTPEFHRAHLPHEEFYERVLRLERDPRVIHEKYEPYFAGRPELVGGYERRYAFHGVHPLHAWYHCAPARRRASRILAVYGDPRSCARLGFSPAASVEEALQRAREDLGKDQLDLAVVEVTPPFWVKV